MARLTHTCPSCGVYIEASDRETLEWGVKTHDCARVKAFAAMIAGTERSREESDLICWLLGTYGRPFWWFRADGSKAVLVS